jgi:hypothetical protein
MLLVHYWEKVTRTLYVKHYVGAIGEPMDIIWRTEFGVPRRKDIWLSVSYHVGMRRLAGT